MAKIPTMDEMAKQLAEKALDKFYYNDKSLREWMRIIASEDAISRAEVIVLYDEYRPKLATHVSEFGDKLKALPSVQPKLKSGKWIRWYEEITIDNGVIEHRPHCKCSECNREYDSYSTRFMNYCPNCGTRMEVE